MAKKLPEFLKNYSAWWNSRGNLDKADYTRLSIDSRTLRPGDLFVAISGENHDGHKFIDSAIEGGAAGVVVNRRWFEVSGLDLPVPVLGVEDTLDFLQQLAAWHRRRFAIPVLAVTGSAGKTTTREMICAVLRKSFTVAGSEGNRNNHIGVPLSLLNLSGQTGVGVFELGSNHPGEISCLAEWVQPTIAVITNIGKGHLGNFESVEAICREKTSLFEALPSGSRIILNNEDAFLKEYRRNDVQFLRIGLTPEADVYAASLRMDDAGCYRYFLQGSEEVILQVAGRYQVFNSLLAAATGIHFGLDLQKIGTALNSYRAEKQRMRLTGRNGITFIDDSYNASPDSTSAAIRYLNELPANGGRKIFVFGDMLELGKYSRAEHRLVGEQLLKANIDTILLYGEETRATCDVLTSGEASRKNCKHFKSHKAIAEELKTLLKKGDRVLVKGSRGMKMENVLNYLIPE